MPAVPLNLMLVSLPLLATGGWQRLLPDPRLWLFALAITAFTLLEGAASRETEPERPTSTRAAALPYLAGPALLGVFWLSLYGAAITTPFLTAAGAVALAAGIALRFAAIQTLRRYFTSHVTLALDHRLITGGIYARLRHPSELGLLLVALGAALLMGSAPGLLFAAAVLMPLSLYRIRLEDRMLAAAFGERFRRYKGSTPALLPHWRIGAEDH